jgi:UDP-galactopyranose mutase
MLKTNKEYDYLIVGAGISGCIIAERLASIGKRILLIDKREHIGGNCYDFYDHAGVLIHKYGPHYFRANSQEVVDYLSKFTEWIPHRYKVKVRIKDQLFSFPINKKTFEQFFGKNFSTEEELFYFVSSLKEKSINPPKNAEEQIIFMLGREMYESFFKDYTEKQWGIPPKKLDATVTARIPIRFNENEDYVSESFQAMPRKGYTSMFKEMLSNSNIDIQLNKNYSEELERNAEKIIWTGRIDEYFNFKFGKLNYRSLKFIFSSFYGKEFVQEEGQINYPSREVPYTRIVEIKHVTHQKCPNTTISIEIPCSEGEPYYPIPTKEGKDLYERYLSEAKKTKKVYFLGRLARYKYLNMDQCVEEALRLFKEIKDG